MAARPDPFADLPAADADGAIARGVRRLAHLDIPGGGQVVARDGFAFVGHMSPPAGTSVIDIRDPRSPRVVAEIAPPPRSHSHKVAVAGGLMLVNVQRDRRKLIKKAAALAAAETALAGRLGRDPSPAETAAELAVKEADIAALRDEIEHPYADGGFRVFDVSRPESPREVAFQKTGGFGVHGFDFDGRFAFVSTEMEGFRGNILVVYDLARPDTPVEAARWWLPGQGPGEDGPGGTGGRQLHHGLRCGDRFYGACWQAGLRILDVADPYKPSLLGAYDYHPPFSDPTHTVMELPARPDGRRLALGIDEVHHPHPHGQPRAALWVLDVTDASAIQPVSLFQLGELDSPYSRVGRFGAGQIVEHPTGDRVFSTWFAGGLQVLDMSDPARLSRQAFYIPPPPDGAAAPESMDAEVDERGIVLLLDRQRGLDILEPTG